MRWVTRRWMPRAIVRGLPFAAREHHAPLGRALLLSEALYAVVGHGA